MQRNNPIAALMAAAAIGLMSAGTASTIELSNDRYASRPRAVTISPAKMACDQQRVQAQKAAWLRMRRSSRRGLYPRPGVTVRHGQRLARKARNQAHNRRAHRRAHWGRA